jgi:hypothetical protein
LGLVEIDEASRDGMVFMKGGTYPHIIGQKLLAIGLGKGNLVLDLSALSLLALVAVSDSGVSSCIGVLFTS